MPSIAIRDPSKKKSSHNSGHNPPAAKKPAARKPSAKKPAVKKATAKKRKSK